MTIETMIIDYIRETGMAEITEQDGKRGVLFFDEQEFIPFDDLGFNRDFGFYRKSILPNVTDESEAE